MNESNELLADAVFEGGGAKGIAYAGALEVFEKRGYGWKNIAGASAGAITASLLAVGYPANEIREILDRRIDYDRLKDTNLFGKIKWIGPFLNLLFTNGMYKGDYLLNLMRDLLREGMAKYHPEVEVNGEVNFGHLITPKEKEDSQKDYERLYKWKLHIVVSDISANSMLVLPRDSKERLGIEPDKLEVALVVRMSASIPVFFQPVKFKTADGKKHTMVDGGMLSNFPIAIFDSPGVLPPPWPTFGFLLWEPGSEIRYKRIGNVFSLGKALLETLINAHDNKALEKITNSGILRIPTGLYRTTQFDLDDRDVKWLCDSGAQAAEEFLQSWSFDAYKDERSKRKTWWKEPALP